MTTVTNYSALIDNIQQVQANTKKFEKRDVIKELAAFLHSEGYQLLAETLTAKARELTSE